MDFNLQIFGKTSIESSINPDKEFSVAFMKLGVDKEEEDKTNDRITYKCKSLGEVIIKEGDTVIKSKPKKGSQSQYLRRKITELYDNQYSGGDINSEDFYIKTMGEIIEKINNKII